MTEITEAPNRSRQARYAANQRALGRRQRSFWLTDHEAEAVQELISSIREKDKGVKK